MTFYILISANVLCHYKLPSVTASGATGPSEAVSQNEKVIYTVEQLVVTTQYLYLSSFGLILTSLPKLLQQQKQQ